jgi:hypothetical protein
VTERVLLSLPGTATYRRHLLEIVWRPAKLAQVESKLQSTLITLRRPGAQDPAGNREVRQVHFRNTEICDLGMSGVTRMLAGFMSRWTTSWP